MDNIKQPTKERIRHYMAQRQAEHRVPPSMQEIRRRLGWELAAIARDGRTG